MTTTPTRAYDLLDPFERQQVDDYVQFAVGEQHRKRERIIHALYLAIPSEYLRRSQNSLYKPLLRAAVAERIREESHKQDISPDRVVQEHASIAFSNMFNYIEAGGFGEFKLKDVEQLTPDMMQAVKSIETKPGNFGLQCKIVLHDKHPSLKALGEMMGLVASDRPPALQQYIAPPKDVSKQVDLAPESEYAELLESLKGENV